MIMDMNKIAFALIACMFAASCSNKKSKAGAVSGDTTVTEQTKTTINKPDEDNESLQKTKEELEGLSPLTKDQLYALVPNELMGADRTDMDFNSSIGTGVATADYKINDNSRIKLELVDCGGPGGAGIFGLQYINMLGVSSEDEDEYIKTIDLNGKKAFENCKKKINQCSIAWFTGKRFLVSLTGENVAVDKLKEAARNLRIQ